MYRKSQGGLSFALMSATSLKHPMKKMATTGDKCMSRNIATPPSLTDTQRWGGHEVAPASHNCHLFHAGLQGKSTRLGNPQAPLPVLVHWLHVHDVAPQTSGNERLLDHLKSIQHTTWFMMEREKQDGQLPFLYIIYRVMTLWIHCSVPKCRVTPLSGQQIIISALHHGIQDQCLHTNLDFLHSIF